MSQAMQNMKDADNQKVQEQINALKNVTRLAQNTLNLINDMEIKCAYAGAVLEIQQWLDGIAKTITSQQSALEALLPKTPEVIDVKLLEEATPGAEGAR